ncbi:hypothetical protein E1267_39295 [Nonomuraea longispora]|uniref:Lipoprotein n=1 Tax=Nonomuraea longispora TaxID=1848320 RepID=A0A4R4MPH2_9ACTN|nr:hypothetical protein [Nonomuraea longispora]TDB97904.1 hypothetical protein E1267_39295 [Nonomuraea longispora]
MKRVMAVLGTIGLGVAVLAGCGQAERPYTPQGAASPASGQPVPDPSKSEGGTATASGAETLNIGGDKLRVRIEWPDDPDPLLKLITGYYVASRKALVSGSDRYLKDLDLELTAVREAYDWVHGYTKEDMTVRGDARLYNLRVAALVGKGVQVNACVDESEVRVLSTGTGKPVEPQPAFVREPYLQAVLAHRGDDGVWRIRSFGYGEKGCSR